MVYKAFHCQWVNYNSSSLRSEKELQEDGEDDDEEKEEDSGPSGEQGCDVIESGDVGVLFLEQFKSNCSPDERTDFINFRGLLWRSMAQFPDRVEPRSRELSPLLLRFIRSVFTAFLPELCYRYIYLLPSECKNLIPMLLFVVVRNEFYPADLLVAPTQSLRKRDDAALEESGMAVEEEEGGEEEEQEAEEGSRQQRKALPRRAAAK